MDYFGGPQFQLLVSLVVLVCVAFVALVCDLLKRNNEQLRELAVELTVRQEQYHAAAAPDAGRQESHAVQLAAAAAARRVASAQSLERAIERVAEKQARAPEAVTPSKARRDSRVAREAELAMERGNEIVAVRPRKNGEAAAADVQPVAAFADIRTRRKAAMRARMEQVRVDQAAEAFHAPAIEMDATRSVEADLNLEGSELPIRDTTASPTFERIEPRLTVDQKNLLDEILAATVASTPALHREHGRGRSAVRRDLLSSIESRVNRLETDAGFAADSISDSSPAARLERAIEATQIQAGFSTERPDTADSLPAGFKDGFVLSKLVQSRNPIAGLVVSVGMSNSDRKTGRVSEPVNDLIRSLLGADDFGCQSGEDEFLLIFPNERGAAAQRKLNLIAERLWDFQLRSMGSFSVLFSWGGVEVNGESIDEAIRSATGRMQETRRSRNVAAIGRRQQVLVSEPARRVAV